jgi:uncharacterized membrane protein YraQ (UPF0718 family)
MSETLAQMASVATGIVLEAGFWIVMSLLAGGLIHEFLPTARLRTAMHRSGVFGVLGAVGLGALLPICSCGVIPLAVSFYLSGVRLAAVMAFAVATPVINPAAVILSYALLGPELTLAYLVFGLVAPFLIGYFVEYGGAVSTTAVAVRLESCCASGACSAPQAAAAPLARRFWRALRWGFGELGPTLGLYIGAGAVLAGVLATALPADWISRYLGASAPFTSLLLVALFGAGMYVCAVAHIPLVAALLAAGAGPGAAIVFLVTGAATNLPEFIALQRVLGTRAVLLYVGGLIGLSLLAGTLVNLWLDGYRPLVDPLRSLELGDLAARLTPVIPEPVAIASALVVAGLIAWGFGRWFHGLPRRLKAALSVGS